MKSNIQTTYKEFRILTAFQLIAGTIEPHSESGKQMKQISHTKHTKLETAAAIDDDCGVTDFIRLAVVTF